MKIPNKCKYIEIQKFGAPEVLSIKIKKVPEISDNEVLIKVIASGVNRPDVLQRQGKYLPPKNASNIPGLEVSGIIVKLGKNVKCLKLNQKVCALTHGGGYAEYCKVYWKHVLPIPKNINFIEAAAIPETFFTVWYNLFDLGKLKKKETILIHGGSSGIGTTAIQLARLKDCKTIVTVGSQEKAKACKKLGADIVINYKKSDFFNEIKNIQSFKGIDVILDMVGKNYFKKNLSLLNDKGRLILIAFLTGSKTDFDLKDIIIKRLNITGSTLRPRSNKEKSRIARNVFKSFWTELSKKSIKPIIYKTFELKNANKAHKLMESSKHIGKIVLTN